MWTINLCVDGSYFMEDVMEERVLPMKVTVGGETYELDYNRDAVALADRNEFNPDDVTNFPQSKIPELWFYAFRKNHRKMARNQTDALLNKIGGLTSPMLQRLLLLFNQARMANVIQDEEDLAKNAEVTVELL